MTTDYGRSTGGNCLKVIPSKQEGTVIPPTQPGLAAGRDFQSSRDETAVRHATDLDTETDRRGGGDCRGSLSTIPIYKEFTVDSMFSRSREISCLHYSE